MKIEMTNGAIANQAFVGSLEKILSALPPEEKMAGAKLYNQVKRLVIDVETAINAIGNGCLHKVDGVGIRSVGQADELIDSGTEVDKAKVIEGIRKYNEEYFTLQNGKTTIEFDSLLSPKVDSEITSIDLANCSDFISGMAG